VQTKKKTAAHIGNKYTAAKVADDKKYPKKSGTL
jgi:hypothetical protein